MDVFPSKFPQPNRGARLSQTENIVEVNFGDNYSQRASMGINAKKLTRTLEWNPIAPEMAKELDAWLRNRKNLSPFLFTYFEDTERQYLCRDVELTDSSPSPCKVSATFEQSYDIEGGVPVSVDIVQDLDPKNISIAKVLSTAGLKNELDPMKEDIAKKTEKFKQISEIEASKVLLPNTFHVWGTMSSLTVTLGLPIAGIMNEYMFQFISGVIATTLNLPDTIILPEDYLIKANKTYQISIVNNLLIYGEW